MTKPHEPNQQVNMLEARPDHGFAKGKVDPREAGRKGARVREDRWLERQGQAREELMALAPEAVEGIGGIIRGDVPPNRLPASTAVLDRIGLGPKVKHDVEVKGPEALAAIILRLDAQESPDTH